MQKVFQDILNSKKTPEQNLFQKNILYQEARLSKTLIGKNKSLDFLRLIGFMGFAFIQEMIQELCIIREGQLTKEAISID